MDHVNPSFSSFDSTGLLFDYSNNKFPTRLYAISGDAPNFKMDLREGSTYFVYVQSGNVYHGIHNMPAGFYGSVKRKEHATMLITTSTSRAIVIERIGYNGVFMIGGPIEAKGRLKYIDGCTDSLLVPPVMYGDPCLNHLHFPPHIDQTMHTHPSMRVGLVTRGSGECITPFGNIPLYTGQIFIIHEETGAKALGLDGQEYLVGSHCFRTFEETMDVIAYHPDSDFGPKDEEHPMINRTIVEGVSAKFLKDIQTQ